VGRSATENTLLLDGFGFGLGGCGVVSRTIGAAAAGVSLTVGANIPAKHTADVITDRAFILLLTDRPQVWQVVGDTPTVLSVELWVLSQKVGSMRVVKGGVAYPRWKIDHIS